MRATIKGLFVVVAMAAPAYADNPRVLRTGAPACGNVMSEEMQERKGGETDEERARREVREKCEAARELAITQAKHERHHAKARRAAAREARRVLAPFVARLHATDKPAR